MAAPERRLSAEAKPFAPPTGPTLAKVVSRDDDEPPRRRGVIVDNLKVSYGFVRLDDDAAAQDLFLHLCVAAVDAPSVDGDGSRFCPLPSKWGLATNVSFAVYIMYI